jgi:hypothetical protein
MTLLTEDEEWNLWNAQGIDAMNKDEAIMFARAYVTAMLAKSKPIAQLTMHDDTYWFDLINYAVSDGEYNLYALRDV